MSYSTRRGLVQLVGVSSEDECDSLYDSVQDEAALLGKLLEYNNARLIRAGVARKVEALSLVDIALQEQYARRPVPNNKSVSPLTQFQVSRTHAFIGRGLGLPDPNSICVNICNPTVTTVYEIGKRIIADGAAVEVFAEPGIDVADVILVGGLIDRIQTEVDTGTLPHLDKELMNQLWVESET